MLLALPLLKEGELSLGHSSPTAFCAKSLPRTAARSFRRAAENQLHVIDERARDLFPAVSVRALPEGEGASHFDARLAYRG